MFGNMTNMEFEIHYIANSSILIKNKDTGILIDGPYADWSDFDSMSKELENDIVNGNGIFSGVDTLLFTHGHTDHFGYKRAYLCTKKRNVKIAAPIDCFDLKFDATDNEVINSSDIIPVSGDKGELVIGSMRIKYFKTHHLAVRATDIVVDHYSYVIESGDHRIFVSGDIELDDSITDTICDFGHYDAVFVNLVIVQHKKWFQNLMKIDTGARFVYHIPSEENDSLYYRRAALSVYKKWHGEAPYQLLLEQMQKIWSSEKKY